MTISKLKYPLYVLSAYMLWRWITRNGKGCVWCMALPHYSDGCIHDLTHPLYNAREASKQILLLEKHLFDPKERCTDCIRKHFLTIEGLIEEAVTLDRGKAYHFIHTMPPKIRRLEKAYVDGIAPDKVAQGLRVVRKQLVEHSFVSGLSCSGNTTSTENNQLP